MFRRQLSYGALALLFTVLSAMGPASAQAQADAAAAAAAPQDVPQYINGWEPKSTDEVAQDADEPGSIADTFIATHKSAKAVPVVGTIHRTDAVGTVDLRHLLPGANLKRDRERRENEGPTPHPVILPGTEGTPSAVEQAPGGGLSRLAPQPAAAAPAPIITFDGLDFLNWGGGHPPDNNGDVGPTYYITTVNTSIGIYNKSTGARVAAFTFDSFMSLGHFGNLCDTDNFGDPVVVYDSFEDRWIITDFAFTQDGSGNINSNVYQCYAVSRSGDPVTGGWYYYSDVTSDVFPDYPKFGIWPDGLYRSTNNFGPGTNGSGFVGTRVWAYNKAQMYAGAAAIQIVQFNTPDAGDFSLLPSNARLQAGTPPAGRPNYFVSLSQYLNAQNVYAFHVDWARPSQSTFALLAVPLASSSWANAASFPGSPTPKNTLDSLAPRAMVQNQYSNIGGVESLWDSHTIRRTATGANTPRWYQINVSGGSVAANDVQSTNWDPDAADTNYRWMPSLAVDRVGNMALGYSLSSATTNPKIMYAGRLAGDAVNTFSQTEQTMYAGTGSQTGNCGPGACTRWGDYTAMTLDPDGCRFWYINEYYTTNDLNDLTRIGAFKYPSCTPVGNGGTLSGTVTVSPGGSPISGATVQLGSRVATTDASGFYSFAIPAGTYTVETANAAGYNPGSASSLAVTDGGTTTQNFALSAAPAGVCNTDTTQSDFQTAALTNIDLASSPGDAVLTSTSLVTDAKQETNTGTGFGFTNTSWIAQTFTAATTGQLTSADVYLFCSGCSGANPNITVSVRASSGSGQTGLPTGADLATGTVTGFSSGSGSFQSVTFGAPVNVTAGTQYALVVRSVAARTTGIYAYTISNTSGANPYAGGRNATSANSGSTWSGQTRSLVFHTYVTVPKTYSSSGDLVSNAKDANPAPGYTPTWSTLSWTGSTPASTTLRFQAAGSNAATGPFNFVGPDGTAGTYFTSGNSLSQFNGSRYVKYHAYLATSNTASSPVLSDVTLCSTNTPPAQVATKLAFTAQPPASSLVGAAFSTQVSVEDASGNVVTGDTSPVTVALSGGTGGATLGGTATVNAVNGVATFPNLSVNTAGTAYKLNATDDSLTGAASNAFDIVPNTYTVGGNIGGLVGSVSLKLDGTTPTSTQTQTFNANGSFTFTTALQSGSGWTVSVATQPAGQTCAVTSGNGSNLSANVTTVQVTCTTNTYTIGGSVSGLTASGLVLAVTAGSQTVTVPSGATSYVFPTAEPTGTAYTVSVQTQPIGLTCSVANASGTIANANVANANISCTTNLYLIGGNISGLAGSVLLKLDSTIPTTTQTQTFAANGSFTFASSLAYGSGWTVSVATQPTGQTCAVMSGSGTNLSANVTAVQVACTTNTYTVTASVSGGNGTITPPSQSVNYNGTASFTVTPSTGYHVAAVTGDTCTITQGSGNSWTSNAITQACAVTATFAINAYTVTASVSGGNGTITPPSQSVNYNGTASFTVTPSTGYHVAAVTGDTCTVTQGSGNSWTSNAITQACAVTATFAINTYTLTYTAGTNGSIVGTTPQTVNYGASGTPVTATPNTGYHFVQWSDGVLTAARTDTNVTANVSVTASFAINTYTLTYTAGTNGSIVGTTPQTVNHGASGTPVTATPSAGYHFVQWSDGVLTAARTDTNVTANVSVTASFAINSYTVTASVSGGNGTITPASQSVNYNGTASFTVTPSTGYHVASVTGDTCTATQGSGNSWTSNAITQACAVTATFAINAYTVTAAVSGSNGTITPASQSVNYNGTASFTVTPATGYHVASVSGDTCTVTQGSGNSWASSAITQACAVTATFAINTYTLTYTAGTNGSIVGTTPQTVNYGASGTSVTATPSTGYHFVQWSDGVLTAARTDTNVTANLSVTASFAINAYTVTASVSGSNGTITPPSQSVNYNGTASFTVTPATGYHVASVSGDTCTVTQGSGNSWSGNAITQSCAVTATFAINAYTVTAAVSGGNGTITPPSQSVNYNGTASFTATPVSSAYHVVSVVGDTCTVTQQGTSTTWTSGSITQACTVTATFAINPPDHLMFVTQPADVFQGDRLGALQVAIVDVNGNVIATDSSSQVMLSTSACGGSVTLGQATVSNGIASFGANASKRFYTLASSKQLSAASGSYSGAATVNVVTGGELLFADDFDSCRL